MDNYTHDGLTFDVTDSGDDAQRVVIALHGFPEDRHCWASISDRLSEAGYRTLAPDQRGYSPRAQPVGRGAYRIDLLAGDVLALADASGARRFDLLGHDWGAVVAWYLAARHPNRVRTLTALSVPHPRAFQSAMTRSDQALRSWYMVFFQIPWLPERILATRGGSELATRLKRDSLDAATAERYATRAANPDAMTGPVNWYRAIAFEARRRVDAVAVPTLYIWGAEDRFVTSCAAQACVDHVTGPYRFVTLAHGSHWLPTGAADEVAPPLLEHLAATPE